MEDEKIRQPAVAGQFYTADPKRLKAEIDAYLAEAAATVSDTWNGSGPARGVVSPHAGYTFSGPTAAKTFHAAVGEGRGKSIERVVLLAPSHRVPFAGLAASSHSAFRTPLGDIQVDGNALAKLLDACGSACSVFDDAHSLEHSLEVQLPFIQTVLPGVPIVPLVCGGLSDEIEAEAVEGLLDLWGPGNLWVASSDFTHYGASFGYVPFSEPNLSEKLEKLDMGAVEKILKLDRDAFHEYLEDTGATICGAAPIKLLLATMEASKENINAEMVELTNSGEISGDYSHCVGYAGIAFFPTADTGGET
jgi:AmmeMemoRadiSam system protein B